MVVEWGRLYFSAVLVGYRDGKGVGAEPVWNVKPFVDRMQICVSFLTDAYKQYLAAKLVKSAERTADGSRGRAVFLAL